jgi:hypothetical protein
MEPTNAELDAQVLAFDGRAGERMIEAVTVFLGRFVSYPSEHAHVAHALWIIHTHMMNAWDSTPRLAFLSAEPASGKTRALEITELLVPNPVPTVNVSPAYLFRKVGSEDSATILFDEIDTVFGPRAKDNEDIRGLLNAGHRRGATTGRCVMNGKQVLTEELPAYAAVALAGLGLLPDTLLSRSVIVRMRRRHAGERVEPFRRRIHGTEGRRIFDLIDTWAKSVSEPLAWPDLPPEIADRNADVWEPLIMIADTIGGKWPQLARQAGVALVADAKEVEPSLGIKLLHDIRTAFGDGNEMASKALLQVLHQMEESPWADLRGKPLDERGLSQRLRQYGVKSKTVRIGTSTPKGYSRLDFADVWARYLPPAASPTCATSATSDTFSVDNAFHSASAQPSENHQPIFVADVADVADMQGIKRVCAHCSIGEGDFCEASLNGQSIWLHASCKDHFKA